MGLIDKIKNALFDEDEKEFDEGMNQNKIARKIDVNKTVEDQEIKIRHYDEPKEEITFNYDQKEQPKAPIIFDVEDFVEEEQPAIQQEPMKNEQKILYGGYTEQFESKKAIDEKEKFHPSPVISPVYGILDKNYVPEKRENSISHKSIDNLFVEDRKKKLDLDTVRQKAYGEGEIKSNTEDKKLLYEMEDIDDKPGIDKISLGDAEEYFEDLGLEYDVDYKDLAKEKLTRSTKNKELTEEIDEEIKETKKIEAEKKTYANANSKDNEIVENSEEPDEKNLYDLIDMMYDNNKE